MPGFHLDSEEPGAAGELRLGDVQRGEGAALPAGDLPAGHAAPH